MGLFLYVNFCMAKSCQNELGKAKIGDFQLGEFPWKEPKLSKPMNDDLSKQWAVVYGPTSIEDTLPSGVGIMGSLR